MLYIGLSILIVGALCLAAPYVMRALALPIRSEAVGFVLYLGARGALFAGAVLIAIALIKG